MKTLRPGKDETQEAMHDSFPGGFSFYLPQGNTGKRRRGKKGKEQKVAMSRIKGRKKDERVNSNIIICLVIGCQVK